jgi:hypothetical protein
MFCRAFPMATAVGVGALMGCAASDRANSDTSKPGFSLAASPDDVPLSWTKGAWFIDPANATGVASDKNECDRVVVPCATFAEVARRWGTNSPRLRQDTTLTFLSSQANANDPVRLDPYIENGAVVSLQGALGSGQVVASGTLADVVPKNRAAGQLLEATLPSGALPGQLIVNTTNASRAWVYRNVSGNRLLISQPLTPESVPYSWNPIEVDLWANGDAVTLYQPVAVNLSEALPVLADCNSGDACTNPLVIYQATVLDPTGGGAPLTIAGAMNVALLDSSLRRPLSITAGAADWYPDFIDVDTASPLSVDAPAGYLYVSAGQFRAGAVGTRLVGVGLQKDVIAGVSLALGDGIYGSVFLDQGVTLSAIPGVDWYWTPPGTGGGSPALWGPGALDVSGIARFEYPAGDGGASATFLQTGGLTIGGQSAACSVDTLNTGVWSCGIPLTPANLDLAPASGGFGGLAAVQGGGSLSNVEY